MNEIKNLLQLMEEKDKYKQALEKIRGIAQYECTHNCSNDSNNCTIGSCIEKRVQRKINEVLGE